MTGPVTWLLDRLHRGAIERERGRIRERLLVLFKDTYARALAGQLGIPFKED